MCLVEGVFYTIRVNQVIAKKANGFSQTSLDTFQQIYKKLIILCCFTKHATLSISAPALEEGC